jgi:CBS domain-containing protein
MSIVQSCLQKKPQAVYSVKSSDSIELALQLMRDKRVRAILVVDLLPKKDPQLTTVAEAMTSNPLTVKPENTLDECMAIMVHKHIRHLPVVSNHSVMGVISVGDVVKNIIESQGTHIKFLETYIKGHGS